MKRFFYRIGLFFAFTLDVYFLWSRWNQRKQSKKHVPAVTTYDEIRSVMRQFEWRKDPLRQLGDSIDTPWTVWERMHKADAGHGDCDEAAVLCLDMGREGFTRKGEFWAALGILTCPCIGGGHNVAVFYCGTRRQYAYIGNWQGGRLFDGFADIATIARDVAYRMDRALSGWALTTPDLKKRLEQKIL